MQFALRKHRGKVPLLLEILCFIFHASYIRDKSAIAHRARGLKQRPGKKIDTRSSLSIGTGRNILLERYTQATYRFRLNPALVTIADPDTYRLGIEYRDLTCARIIS